MVLANTMVPAAKTMVSVAPAMVCKVLSIGVLIVNRAPPIPSWLFLELQPAHVIFASGNSLFYYYMLQ